MSITKKIKELQTKLNSIGVQLIAVSKTKPIEDIKEAYDAGQRDFGENIVQEIMRKKDQLPEDIHWHMIGHLQRNKVKYIAPFITMVHSVDSLRLLNEINKEAKKNDRIIDVLLQVHIAAEETKHGFDHSELIELLREEAYQNLKNIRVRGLMGMATFTDNEKVVKEEFYELKMLFDGLGKSFFKEDQSFDILCMGMSSDYTIAIQKGSNMVRVGSIIFGERNTNKEETKK